MVNKTQYYHSKVYLAVQSALNSPYFYSDKEEGASGAVDDGYLDAPSKE
jgi:hypothetical protein